MRRKLWMMPAGLILAAGLAFGIACDDDDDDNDVLPNGDLTPITDTTPANGGLETPANGLETPTNGLETPDDGTGIETPAN